ncbi:MAG: hypothetical protein ABJA78_06670 [Ferruginibacter sp.]
MALEEFEREELDPKEKRYVNMRSMMDMGMGILWVLMGIFLLISEKVTDKLPKLNDITFKMLGGIAVVYGLFRIYRGYKKNYFR